MKTQPAIAISVIWVGVSISAAFGSAPLVSAILGVLAVTATMFICICDNNNESD